MSEVFVSRDPEQPAARAKAGRELEVGEIGAAVATDEPVLLLGKIIVADPGAVQLAQCLLGGSEIVDIVKRLCQMQCHPVDESAHQRLPAGPQQFGSDTQVARQDKRVAFAPEQMACQKVGPPRNLIDPTQYRIDVAVRRSKAAALDRGEHVALEQHAFGPSRR